MAQTKAQPLHGGQLRQIAERFNLPQAGLLDFSANINPSGPPAAVFETLRASLEEAANLTEYPDLEQVDLKRAVARYAGVDEANVVVANGFVPLLEAAVRALAIRSCVVPVPAFVEYRRTLERAGIGVIAHPLRPASGFQYDASALVETDADAILIANPQNPSGVCHDRVFLEHLVTLAAAKKISILLDEAFVDYVPEHSLGPLVGRFENLIVFRSVTKFHGVPGLRVAYALANPRVAAIVDSALPPWPVTTVAALAVAAALEDRGYAARSRAENFARRDSLCRELQSAGFAVYPSAANFLLLRLPLRIDPQAFWEHLIVQHGIVLRDCSNYEELPAGHFRAAVRDEADNTRLAVACMQALASL